MIELNINELVMKKAKEIAMRKEDILEAFIAKYGYEPDDMIVCEQPSTGSFWVEKRTTEYKHAQECLKIADAKLEKCIGFISKFISYVDGFEPTKNLVAEGRDLIKELDDD